MSGYRHGGAASLKRAFNRLQAFPCVNLHYMLQGDSRILLQGACGVLDMNALCKMDAKCSRGYTPAETLYGVWFNLEHAIFIQCF